MKCENVDYFPKEEYSPDPNDSTMAIPYAVKRASAFIFMSCITMLLGYLLCVVGSLCRRRPVISFASGVAFILSGLLILTGMVIYISTFKSEVGNKLRPKSSFQGPMFRYHYGYSFILAVCGLMMCELAGTFTIFLFIHWHKVDIAKKQRHHHQLRHCISLVEYNYTRGKPKLVTEEKARGAFHSSSQVSLRHSSLLPVTWLSTSRGKSAGPRGPLPAQKFPPVQKRHHMHHHHHYAKEPEEDHVPCRRHSYGRPPRRGSHRPGDTSPPRLQGGTRRHSSLQQSESMRDLDYYNFPVVSRDTTCNTVSTSADITRDITREFSFEILRRTTPV